MKLLETIKSKLIAAVLAIWAWLQLKAVQWQLREKAIALWEKAKAFLNLANESAEAEKKNAEIEALKQENAKIKAETDAKLSKMQEQMEALLAAVAEKQPKTRKSKAVEA